MVSRQDKRCCVINSGFFTRFDQFSHLGVQQCQTIHNVLPALRLGSCQRHSVMGNFVVSQRVKIVAIQRHKPGKFLIDHPIRSGFCCDQFYQFIKTRRPVCFSIYSGGVDIVCIGCACGSAFIFKCELVDGNHIQPLADSRFGNRFRFAPSGRIFLDQHIGIFIKIAVMVAGEFWRCTAGNRRLGRVSNRRNQTLGLFKISAFIFHNFHQVRNFILLFCKINVVICKTVPVNIDDAIPLRRLRTVEIVYAARQRGALMLCIDCCYSNAVAPLLQRNLRPERIALAKFYLLSVDGQHTRLIHGPADCKGFLKDCAVVLRRSEQNNRSRRNLLQIPSGFLCVPRSPRPKQGTNCRSNSLNGAAVFELSARQDIGAGGDYQHVAAFPAAAFIIADRGRTEACPLRRRQI